RRAEAAPTPGRHEEDQRKRGTPPGRRRSAQVRHPGSSEGACDVKKIRLAIVGVGNCASALVQGLEYYLDASSEKRVPGLMHVRLGDYHVRDIEVVAGF